MINKTSTSLRFQIEPESKKFKLEILDQTLLPHTENWIEIVSLEQMIEAIQSLRVRGAPLIGISASLFLAKKSLEGISESDLSKAAHHLYEARPTAVNLMICIDRMKKALPLGAERTLNTALQIYDEDIELCEQIATHSRELIQNGDTILTHCNTGGLATAGRGTALGLITKAAAEGKKFHVYVDETRPLLQGARLTTWELEKNKIPYTLICDNMAAHLMSLGKISKVLVGSDRIARNGDFANKIGTYSLAVSSHYHQIPFYVVAPYTTVDTTCESGKQIPIEQRTATEVKGYSSVTWAPQAASVYNPSFDVTPAELVTGWVTDRALYTKNDILKGCFT